MKSTIRWRYLLYVFLLGAAIVLGIVFRSWLVTYWIEPLALVLWAIVRVFLSVHQSVYWAGLIFLAFFLALRILPQKPEEYTRYANTEGQEPVNRVEYWFRLIHNAPKTADQYQALKKELQTLIDDWQQATGEQRVADKQRAAIEQRIEKSTNGAYPIQESSFLDQEREAGKERFWTLKQWLGGSLSRWNFWQTNRSNEYEDAFEQVIGYIETNMETNINEQSGDLDDH